ncbi:YpmS family protein [Amphibacillus sp. MSJ-3]|uniref:YpmS family protein n=1 Tax=Amphibacillus sp. MSJ-3 TaxID=2841505 RepID=UPI001C0EA523|nr:YpmS family protein [Amphibacillus sp. MSJ-3]MBU5593912.1 YpmS family protein [Amphibacillus sp. MSJ-3]
MKERNWQLYFLILFGANVVLITTFAIFIFSTPPKSDPLPTPVYIDEPGAEFKVESTKEDLNELINDYLDRVLLADGADFTVYIDQDIQLTGSLMAFGTAIPLNIRMEPVVQKNGDIVLSMTEMSLGLLNLPKDRILHYINRQIDTPDWLYFDSQNEQLYVAVTQIDIQSNFRFSVQELDLTDEDISFLIKIPQAGVIPADENAVTKD